MNLATIHTDDLERHLDEELEGLTPAQRFYAYLRANGEIPTTAAQRAGFDPATATPGLERKTASARAVYMERISRADGIDVGWLRGRLAALYQTTLGKGDDSGALACLKEIGKLGGLYPQEPANGAGSGPVLVQVALALPARETPPSFLPAPLAQPVDPLS